MNRFDSLASSDILFLSASFSGLVLVAGLRPSERTVSQKDGVGDRPNWVLVLEVLIWSSWEVVCWVLTSLL